jgi:hypothetical protein
MAAFHADTTLRSGQDIGNCYEAYVSCHAINMITVSVSKNGINNGEIFSSKIETAMPIEAQ